MFSWYNFTNYKTTQQTCIFIYILHTHKKQAHYCAHLRFHFEISLKQMIIILLLYFFAFCHKRKLLLLNMHLISYYVIYCFSALYSAYHQKKNVQQSWSFKKMSCGFWRRWWRDKYFFQYFAYYHIISTQQQITLYFFHGSSLWQFCRVLFCVLSRFDMMLGWCVCVTRALSGSKMHDLCKHTWIWICILCDASSY